MHYAKRFIILTLFLSILVTAAACGDKKDEDGKNSDTATKMTTVGFLNYLASLEVTVTNFKTSMAALGYVEGENITYVYNGPVEATPEALDKEIQALVDAKVDLIISIGTPSSQRAKEMTAESKLPIIFTSVLNPVGAGLVADPLKPGGNVTGIDVGAHIVEKSLEWLVTADPSVKKVYLPYSPNDRAAASLLPLLRSAAEKLGLELVEEELANPEADALPALEAAAPNVDGVFFISTSIPPALTGTYASTARELKLPVACNFPLAAGGTCMVATSVDFVKVSDQTARLADQVIKGSNPGDIPVEQAAFTVDINLEAANEMGLEVPDSVLQRANNIYRTIPTPVPTATPTTQP